MVPPTFGAVPVNLVRNTTFTWPAIS